VVGSRTRDTARGPSAFSPAVASASRAAATASTICWAVRRTRKSSRFGSADPSSSS
jgi:hypothetical protein